MKLVLVIVVSESLKVFINVIYRMILSFTLLVAKKTGISIF